MRLSLSLGAWGKKLLLSLSVFAIMLRKRLPYGSQKEETVTREICVLDDFSSSALQRFEVDVLQRRKGDPEMCSAKISSLADLKSFFFGTQWRRSHFYSPSSPLFFPACFLSRLITIERLSLHGSPNWKIMDLINWSLNAIDTIFSTRSLGSGNLSALTERSRWLHDGRVWRAVANRVSSGSFRGGRWRYLPIRNHETGLLLIGLGFTWVIEEFRKREQLSKASQGCPSCLKQWEEQPALRLGLLTAIWILSWRSSRLCKGKLMVLETRMGRESSRELECGYSPQDRTIAILSFLAPRTSTGLGQGCCWKFNPGKSTAVSALASSPILQTLLITNYYTHNQHIHTYIKICTHLPSPDPSPPSLWTASLTSGLWPAPEMAAGTGWLLAGTDFFPVAKSCVYGYVLVAEVFFLFSHCTPQGA